MKKVSRTLAAGLLLAFASMTQPRKTSHSAWYAQPALQMETAFRTPADA